MRDYVRNLLSFRHSPWYKWSKRGGFLFCGLYTFKIYVGEFWHLAEGSMEPTFKDGNIVFVSSWPFCEVLRGDVVIAKHPIDPKVHILSLIHI